MRRSAPLRTLTHPWEPLRTVIRHGEAVVTSGPELNPIDLNGPTRIRRRKSRIHPRLRLPKGRESEGNGNQRKAMEGYGSHNAFGNLKEPTIPGAIR
jgi:hypothetical protein